jgi:hypothetical protein
MASNINYVSVDESFPVAGQDNDSQGFRDNFSTIKSSLASAKTEISELQENSAKLNANNNFNLNEISNAKLRNTPEIYFSKNINSSHQLLFSDGAYQILNVNDDPITIDLSDFRPPTGSQTVYSVRLLLTGNGGEVLWSTGSPSNIFRVNSTWPKRVNLDNEFRVAANQPVLVDIWTTDGVTFYGYYHGTFTAIAGD